MSYRLGSSNYTLPDDITAMIDEGRRRAEMSFRRARTTQEFVDDFKTKLVQIVPIIRKNIAKFEPRNGRRCAFGVSVVNCATLYALAGKIKEQLGSDENIEKALGEHYRTFEKELVGRDEGSLIAFLCSLVKDYTGTNGRPMEPYILEKGEKLKPTLQALKRMAPFEMKAEPTLEHPTMTILIHGRSDHFEPS